MNRTTLGFLYSSLFYLLAGVTIGVLMVFLPGARQLQDVHAHLNLIGFVTFMIFGIAYHILPRFRGRPLYSDGLAWFQFWLANIGFVGFALIRALEVYGWWEGSTSPRWVFAALLGISFYLFVYNIGRTLIGKVPQD